MKFWAILLLSCFWLVSCQSSTPDREGVPAAVEVVNFMNIAPGISSGGQVDPADFPAMADNGYSTVINFRPDSEDYPKDEAKLAESAGLSYYQIPVSGGALTLDSARELQRVLAEAPRGSVLIHCRSGARVGAIWGMYQALENDLDAKAAVAAAWKAGVRKQGLVDQVEKLVSEM